MIVHTITEHVENATAELLRRREQKKDNALVQTEGLLYFGNPHESIPVRLLQDKYLTAKAKFAWQIIKTNAKAYQGTAFPSYDELQQLLSDRPYSNEKASTKVVSQVLLLLRLCRWLTFCSTARDHHGRVLGNIYIIHDEPISIMDAIHFNDDYLAFVEQTCHHKDNLVNQVANQIMQSLLNDEALEHYGSHIHLMRARYAQRNNHLELKTRQTLNQSKTERLNETQQNLLTSHTEDSETDRKVSQNPLTFHREDSTFSQTFHTEIRDKSLISGNLPIRKEVHQYSTYINNNLYSTVLDEAINQFPQPYRLLSNLEKNTLLKISTELNLQQTVFREVLTETALRIQQAATTDKPVKNPIGYLCKMLRNAASGQFKPYLINSTPTLSVGISGGTNSSRITPAIRARTETTDTKMKKTLTAEQLNQRLAMANKMRSVLKQNRG